MWPDTIFVIILRTTERSDNMQSVANRPLTGRRYSPRDRPDAICSTGLLQNSLCPYRTGIGYNGGPYNDDRPHARYCYRCRRGARPPRRQSPLLTAGARQPSSHDSHSSAKSAPYRSCTPTRHQTSESHRLFDSSPPPNLSDLSRFTVPSVNRPSVLDVPAPCRFFNSALCPHVPPRRFDRGADFRGTATTHPHRPVPQSLIVQSSPSQRKQRERCSPVPNSPRQSDTLSTSLPACTPLSTWVAP